MDTVSQNDEIVKAVETLEIVVPSVELSTSNEVGVLKPLAELSTVVRNEKNEKKSVAVVEKNPLTDVLLSPEEDLKITDDGYWSNVFEGLGLTIRQKMFVKEYTDGKNATEASLLSYNCKDRNIAGQVGCRLLKNKQVSRAVHRVLFTEELTPEYIQTGVKVIATKEKSSDKDKLRAYEMLGKSVGLFSEHRSSASIGSLNFNF